ncbi:MAG: hypothetical protein JXR96_28865 [Deltaproteobacteria bacterium]|nr:hypothetical protein [Deltaproteobacteria bacterium]
MHEGSEEVEALGVDYERFALGELLARLVREHGIQSALELPARGEKAMPSIYSLALARAGCRVTLARPVARSLATWESLGLACQVHACQDPARSGLDEGAFDLVWDFAYLARSPDPLALLAEMRRTSRRLVLYVGVNRHNPGFACHRAAHRLFGIAWTHGRLAYMDPDRTRAIFAAVGLEPLEIGSLDAPPFPDSLGIRDTRLHLRGGSANDMEALPWCSRTVDWMRRGRVPVHIRAMHLFERLLPAVVARRWAHLFYLLACKVPP